MPISDFEKEVLTQPQTFATMLAAYGKADGPLSQLDRILQAGRPPSVGYIGMGSSLFAAAPAVSMLTLNGLSSHAFDASEYLYYRLDKPSTFLPVLISQSGESAEIKRIAEQWSGKVPYVAITNTPDSTLGRGAGALLPILGGFEKSTTNKTYTNTIAVAALLGAKVAGLKVDELVKAFSGLPAAMESIVKDWRGRTTLYADFLGDLPHLDILGRGPSLASVWQGTLILRELSHMRTAGYNVGLFRHGLIPGMKRGGCQIVFAPRGVTHNLTIGLVHEVVEAGGKVILVTNEDVKPGKNLMIWRLPEVEGAYELQMPVLEILLMELLGILFAERRGMEPGEGIAKITAKE